MDARQGRLDRNELAVDTMATVGEQRVRLFYAVVALTVEGSRFDIVTGIAYWPPFSPYMMCTAIRRDHSLAVLRPASPKERRAPITLTIR